MIRINYDKGHFIVKPTIFPDKTSQVWNIDPNIFANPNWTVTVLWEFESESEVMHILQLSELLQHSGTKWDLLVPFMPYARQDKAVHNQLAFAMTPFIKVLDLLTCMSIKTYDIHTPWQNIIESISGGYQLEDICNRQEGEVILVYPDQGAFDRYYKMTSAYDCVVFKKSRDINGNIDELKITMRPKKIYKNNIFIIVDDICDGGATFIKTAQLIRKEIGKHKIILYTTHGIYSKGTKVLKKAGISEIHNYKGEVK